MISFDNYYCGYCVSQQFFLMFFCLYQALSSHHQNVTLFDISPSSVPACSSPSLFPVVLSASTLSSTPTSTAATTLPWLGLSTPPVGTQSESASSPPPPTPALPTTLPPALTPSVSLTSCAHADAPFDVPLSQVVSSSGTSHTPPASLNQSLQDLVLLDLGSSTA